MPKEISMPEVSEDISVLEVPKEILVPVVPEEISVPEVPMEISVPQSDVQLLAIVSTDIEVIPGLEWDGTELEIFEDPNHVKDLEVEEPPVTEKATTSLRCLECLGATTPSPKMRTRRSSW
jgi:hypothetical protein